MERAPSGLHRWGSLRHERLLHSICKNKGRARFRSTVIAGRALWHAEPLRGSGESGGRKTAAARLLASEGRGKAHSRGRTAQTWPAELGTQTPARQKIFDVRV